jgi:UDP-2,3-diacylglucosamine hydrolase
MRTPAPRRAPQARTLSTLFVSDLHLDAAWPEVIAQFLAFLRSEARSARALYILGDLFEVWIGDDDPDTAKRAVVTALRELTSAGVACYVMHGNRDFMLGERFCRDTGCRLLEDGTIVELDGERVLLMHGDLLCTDDTSYQRLRRIVRNPLARWIFRHLSLARRERLAGKLRAGSRLHTTATAPEIMDVNDAAVREAFRHAGVETLIHGHTHRPAVHRLEVDGRPVRRIVLGAWHDSGSVLDWSASGAELQVLPR